MLYEDINLRKDTSRFLKTKNKFLSIKQTVQDLKSEVTNSKDYMIFKSDKKNYKIRFDDILYIESLDNYIKVHTKDSSIICYESLVGIEKKLPESEFIRIHRSYIVNYSQVDVFTSSYVEISGRKFTIGRNYKEAVNNRLNA